ncbi:NAD(P)-binding protein [Cystobasidium minutum MCA 4210]|uniref:NAD(P)-binding protein n=1 Tax=Cystobasidium minutum MCA 4210 TaxID=1397322 RepID=UPI0034CD7975|eukprot:jgi/Rhomi1/194617/gm1.2831_g
MSVASSELSPVKPALNRVALVTGSSRGIGKAIALRLARDGFDVVINDIGANKEGIDAAVREVEQIGRKSHGIVCDVTSFDDVKKMIDEVVSKMGKIDVSVANAGIAAVKAVHECTGEDLKRMMDVNLHGVMNCYIHSANAMMKAETKGRIIGAASIVAYKPFPLLTPYSASKWAVRGFTQGCAMEWGRYGIRVNAYAPGIVATPMWDLIDSELGKLNGLGKGETMKKYVNELTALGRTSEPEDVAKTVSFLASDDSEFMTGQTLLCDGGIEFC